MPLLVAAVLSAASVRGGFAGLQGEFVVWTHSLDRHLTYRHRVSSCPSYPTWHRVIVIILTLAGTSEAGKFAGRRQ